MQLILLALLWGCRMADFDADGLLADVDCDDMLSDVYPGADERCDGIDNDCDGKIDEEPIDGDYVFVDSDGDGFGDAEQYGIACYAPEGYADRADDCDDSDPTVSPAAEEVCDGVDNDCNRQVDDGLEFSTYYLDEDGDGFGGPHVGAQQCAPSPGMTAANGDCDDDDPLTHPGAADLDDPELCTRDNDSDGYGDNDPGRYVDPGTDCDDSDSVVNPDAYEICNDFIDNDCDRLIDENC